MDDTDLVLAVRAGDRDAFAGIYDRYADRIHDFCASTLRDRSEAADVMQETFLVAFERLGQLREPDRLKPWLYSIAHHAALKRIRDRSRVEPTNDMTDTATLSDSPDNEASKAELTELVWEAAAGLGDRDRALLDLHVRQGLNGKDLADAAGVTPSHLYVMLNRLRAQVERSMGALLVARTGRRDCPQLAGVLAGWDGHLTPELRARIAHHVDRCATCEHRRSAAFSPLALLAAVPLIALPAHLRSSVLGKAQLSAASSAVSGITPGSPGSTPVSAGWTLDADGFPVDAASRTEREARSPRRHRVILATLAALLIVVAAVTAAHGRAHRALTVSAATGATTTAVVTVPVTDQVVAPPIAPSSDSTLPARLSRLRLDSTTLDFGTSAVALPLVMVNDGPTTASWAVKSTEPTVSVSPNRGGLSSGGSLILTVSIDRIRLPAGSLNTTLTVAGPAGSLTVVVIATVLSPPAISGAATDLASVHSAPCPRYASTATASATVIAPNGLASVVLHWVDPAGTPGTRAMAPQGGGWAATLGPFANPGTARWWVTADDLAGNSSQTATQSLTVAPCFTLPPIILPTSTTPVTRPIR